MIVTGSLLFISLEVQFRSEWIVVFTYRRVPSNCYLAMVWVSHLKLMNDVLTLSQVCTDNKKRLGNNCLKGNTVEFVVSPDSQRTVQGWFNPGNDSGSRALSCSANLRRSKSIPLTVITDSETQSSTVEETYEEGANHEREGTTTFLDENAGTLVDPKPFTSAVNLDGYKADASLSKFLSRPYIIYNTTWSVGSGINVSIPVWANYFNHAVIRNKLANYSYLRCNLKIKIMINASPFYYGLTAAVYTPLPNTNSAPVTGSNVLIPLSQRPLVWLYPQESRGGTITAPFIYPQTWLELDNLVNLTNMGGLDLRTFVDLANANSVVGTDCDIIVYAWAEDVYICGPTNTDILQSSKKKNPGGSVGQVASSISAGDVSTQRDSAPKSTVSVPSSAATYKGTGGTISKPLAQASAFLDSVAPAVGAVHAGAGAATQSVSYALRGAATIASAFGHTDNPIIRDVQPLKNLPFHGFSSSEISEPRDKLTFDPKHSLSKAAGCADVLTRSDTSIAGLCARESYLTQFTWSSTAAFNDLIFSASVNPNLIGVENSGTPSQLVHMIPMAWIGRCFNYWRGDIVFRLRFICTQYHRGRVRITWDPIDDIDTVSNTTASNYNRIVDISEDQDVYVKIPYLRHTAMAKMSQANIVKYSPSDTSINSDFDNGQLTVRVLTQQTSPVVSADITVVVSVWGEDMVFSNPDYLPTYQTYETQSMSNYQEGKEALPLFDGTETSPDFFKLYGGENVTDICQLMRRKSLYASDRLSQNTTDAYRNDFISFRRMPAYPGFDTNGFHVGVDQVGAGASNYNFVHMTFTNWFREAFIGSRGSINWTFNAFGPSYVDSFSIVRYPDVITTRYSAATVSTGLSRDQIYSLLVRGTNNGTAGMSLTNTRNQPSLSIAAPMYSRYKWQLNAPNLGTLGSSFDDSDIDNLRLQITSQPLLQNPAETTINSYVSIGEDFSLIYFLNVPTYHYTVTPDGFP